MTGPTEDEPDPRFTLANERTFLAWVRTMLAVLAGAIALDSLQIPAADALRRGLVLAMLAFAAATVILAYRRWKRVDRAMRRGEALPPFGLGLLVTVAVVAGSVGLGIVVALSGR